MATIKKLLQSAPRMRNSLPIKAQNGIKKPKPAAPIVMDTTGPKGGGLEAFDPYHHGKGTKEGRAVGGLRKSKIPTPGIINNFKQKNGGKTPAWQRKEGKSPSGGLNAKGRASLKAAGHDIKAPQPQGGPRKKSFCARMSGMKKKLTSSKTANDPNSRINKSLRKWKC